MNRWNIKLEQDTENKQADEFLSDIVSICVKHGLSLSHEDSHGAFLIEDYDEENISWIEDAAISEKCTKIVQDVKKEN